MPQISSFSRGGGNPAEFVTLAKEASLTVPVVHWVTRQTALLHSFHKQVNLSSKELMQERGYIILYYIRYNYLAFTHCATKSSNVTEKKCKQVTE